jgi:hypothetical protein
MADHRVDDPDLKVSLIYPNRQFLPAKTRSFVEHTLEHFGRASADPLDELQAVQMSAQVPAQAHGGEMPTSLHAPRHA